MHWIVFALMTVLTWGLYGGFLAMGAKGFEDDRVKAFLFVGVAYFLVAIVGPLLYLKLSGKDMGFQTHPDGIKWSLIAGTLGALGAFTALFALNSHPASGDPKTAAIAAAQVMAVIFAGAPIIAAVFGIVMKQIAGKGVTLQWPFIAGLVLAASGGALVTWFKP